MQPQHNTLSLLPICVILVICAPFQAIAAPWSGSDNVKASSQFPTPQRQHPSAGQPRSFWNGLPQLKFLRNAFTRTGHQLPHSGTKDVIVKPPTKSSNSKLPSKLLAHYNKDVVLRFNLSTAYEEQMLADAADHLLLDVWEFTNNWADIRLGEDVVPSLLEWLPGSLQNSYSLLMPNLADTIEQSYPSVAVPQPSSAPTRPIFTPSLKSSDDGLGEIFFGEYQPLSVIHPWMNLMASMFTTHVRLINIGTSYEGRDILALRVGVSPNLAHDDTRKTIIISGGLHAREWISVSTVLYIAWSLIKEYGKSPGITKLLQEFDFVFIPTLNPDGYVYTWENDRLWRKNRQQTNLKFCQGLDLDRAFGFEWDGNTAQANPCSESYPGEQAFQAVESHRLAEWAINQTEHNSVSFVGFLDLHSYSQQVLYPYSYSCNADPPSLENLEELGMGLAKAIRISSGQQYGVASACEGAVSSASGGVSRMETGGGSAIDWFYHEMRVRYSYQIKLRDTGSYGFLLPKENIVPTGNEAFNAVKYFGDFLLGNRGIETKLFGELYQEVLEPAPNEVESETMVENDIYEAEEVNWELRRRRRR